MMVRISLVVAISFALLASPVFAADLNGQIRADLIKRMREPVKVEVAIPVQSAKSLTRLLEKHSKSDKVTVTLEKRENGVATLTIAGEVAHVSAVSRFAKLLAGELPTREEQAKQDDLLIRKGLEKYYATRAARNLKNMESSSTKGVTDEK